MIRSVCLPAVIPLLMLSTCGRKPPSFEFFFTHVDYTCVSFARPGDPGRYIGYRIVEYVPETTDRPLSDYADQPRRAAYPPPDVPGDAPPPAIPDGPYTSGWMTRHDGEPSLFRSCAGGLAVFRYREREGLSRALILRATEDGADLWAWLESDREIPGSYVVQACFRLSGATNEDWRHGIAYVPELSEFDLWNSGDRRSLTYVRGDTGWIEVQPKDEQADFLTAAGAAGRKSGAVIPHGLILRESADGKSVAGMYWECTTRVSNHHPADCLHAFVDLGPARPGERNVVHGKFYWFDGDKDDLLARWRRDFGMK